MARRRRRRDRRETSADEVQNKAPRRLARAEEKRRADYEAQQRTLMRRQRLIGALGFVPLIGALGCNAGVEIFCVVPREWLLAIWAALFGSFLGITIRLVLERRKYHRGAASGRSA
jgi:hypothetical protein